MARVTVQDCLKRIPNPFELVMVAAQRTRQLIAGASVTLTRSDHKFTIVALKEIEEDTIAHQDMLKNMSDMYRKPLQFDSSEEMDEYTSRETQTTIPYYSSNLSLTGEIDEEEAALEAEFSKIEKNIS